jgi:hypothetical protein
MDRMKNRRWLINNLYFEILLNKSTFGQHERGRSMCVLCNGVKFEGIDRRMSWTYVKPSKFEQNIISAKDLGNF